MIRGLILDMDGTLLDSKRYHIQAWKILIQRYNIQKSDFEIVSQFGKTTEEIAKSLFPPNFDPKQIGAEKDEIFFSLISDVCPFEGVPELISRLKRSNFKICVASSNPVKTIQTICSYCNLDVDDCVGMENVKHGKPAPDMIITAAARLGLPLSECLVIGDTTFDIEAAKAVNCKVVAVTSGSQSAEILENAKPDYILSSITEIEPLLQNLSL
ncbi:MAG: HAD family hydrolase [Candidatus Helarchaeota archaeon]